MSIEKHFDLPLIAGLALREKQIQQSYRPIIAVHKWFARRPGTLFRALALAEFGDRSVVESFFKANDFPDKLVVDPFMGGGIPLLEANRIGCDVMGFDINPMAAWIVREEIEHLDLDEYATQAELLIARLTRSVGEFYRTDCPHYGDRGLPVKYFLWVKVLDCESCGREFDLFPGYLLADDTRHPRHVLVCSKCGDLNEVDSLPPNSACQSCKAVLVVDGPAKRGRCACCHCGQVNKYPRPEAGSPRHRMFAIEYYSPARKQGHAGRFFKKPDDNDLSIASKVARKWSGTRAKYVPTDEIQPGDESSRLHKWGYSHYRDLFNDRQLLGLELSCRLVASVKSDRVRHALATNLSDLLRYQNLLCRYDTMALKSLDIFSVHGFPVGLVQCESNLLGIVNGNGSSVGSGGWTNIVDKYTKAKRYADAPFEIQHFGRRKQVVPIAGEWIGERRKGARTRSVSIRCADSASVSLPAGSVDAVFTDPPYFGNVQYGELMDFCYTWLRRLVGSEAEGFSRTSTRSVNELTGNDTEDRDVIHFTEGIAAVFTRMAKALKPKSPLAFTFHHNKLSAYSSIGVAILDAGFTCTAAIPCPAEMGGSIHIHGTGSSIVDTVFVCRKRAGNRAPVIESSDEIVEVIRDELVGLRSAGMKPTPGDIRCIVFGKLTRSAVLRLQKNWNPRSSTSKKLEQFMEAVNGFAEPQSLIDYLHSLPVAPLQERQAKLPLFAKEDLDAIPF